MSNIKYRTVIVPAYGPFGEEKLIEASVDGLTTGLCRTVEEAQSRADTLASFGATIMTQAPRYQANAAEMKSAWDKLQSVSLRDGGLCLDAIEFALAAGIHTVAWAIASRYLVAGWL